jgi:hypothetical protein
MKLTCFHSILHSIPFVGDSILLIIDICVLSFIHQLTTKVNVEKAK